METPKESLRNQIAGEVIYPQDINYAEARTIYNASIDKKPSLIVKCQNKNDVVTAVNYAQKNKIEVSIKSGGHSGPGLSLVDEGLVIDLSLMKKIEVDLENKTAKVEAGCTWGEVDSATHEFGLATVSGVISNTGVGGLTLGGGHGYLTRKYGLTIDNLIGAEVVLADGNIVNTNSTEYPDLFWAIRGGGGNFGVVTSFEYQLHSLKNVIAGPMFWPIEDLEVTLKWYRDWLPTMPDDVYAFLSQKWLRAILFRRKFTVRRSVDYYGVTPGNQTYLIP